MGIHDAAAQHLVALALDLFEQATARAKSLQRNFARRRQRLDAEVGAVRVLEERQAGKPDRQERQAGKPDLRGDRP